MKPRFNLSPRRSRGRVALATIPAHLLRTLDEVEREHVIRVLAVCDGNHTGAARMLGVDRKTLSRMLQRWFPEDVE